MAGTINQDSGSNLSASDAANVQIQKAPKSNAPVVQQPQVIRDQDTGELSGVSFPDGRSFTGLNPHEVTALVAAHNNTHALPSGAVEASDVAAAGQINATNQQRVASLQAGGTTPISQEQPQQNPLAQLGNAMNTPLGNFNPADVLSKQLPQGTQEGIATAKGAGAIAGLTAAATLLGGEFLAPAIFGDAVAADVAATATGPTAEAVVSIGNTAESSTGLLSSITSKWLSISAVTIAGEQAINIGENFNNKVGSDARAMISDNAQTIAGVKNGELTSEAAIALLNTQEMSINRLEQAQKILSYFSLSEWFGIGIKNAVRINTARQDTRNARQTILNMVGLGQA